MERREKLHRSLKVQPKKSSRISGLVPTSLAEPIDSILSSPKNSALGEEVPNIVDEFLDISSEFVFGDEIDDEISKEMFEKKDENRKIEINQNKSMAKKTKIEAKENSRSSRQVSKEEPEVSLIMKRKRSGSRSSAGSKTRVGSTGKRTRKGSEAEGGPTVKEEKTKCQMCKESFDPSEYRRHNMIEHDYKCDQDNCDYFLESDLALTNHKKKIHFIEPAHSYSSNWQQVCEGCGMIFSNKSWAKHSTTPHPHLCIEDPTNCYMRFTLMKNLTTHIKAVHKEVKKSIPKKSQSPEIKIIACVPKIIKRESAPANTITPESAPANTITPVKSHCAPLATRASSPLPGPNYWECKKCGELVDTEAKLLSHGRKDHSLPCGISGCNYAMYNNAQLLKHFWDIHGKKEKVKFCDVCQDVVDIKSNAAHQKRIHPTVCGYDGCSVQTVTSKLLWMHMIRKHDYGRHMNADTDQDESEDEEIMKIDSAKRSLETSLDLDVDEIENDVIRDEETKSKGSIESWEFIEQVVEPDEGQFIKCKVCELLQKRGKLLAHSKKVHKWKCFERCDLAFTQEILMHQHCFVDHNNTEHISKNEYLVCPECSEFFEPSLKHSFDIHVKNGKHETCSKCDKKFSSSRKDEFNFHTDFDHNLDTDEPCPTCDLKFTSSDQKLLEKHMQKKHQVGPCPHCKEFGKSLLFVTKERFAKHHESEHGTLAILGCDCFKKIAKNVQAPYDIKNEFDVKSEDAYDLSEQITDESSIDEEFAAEMNINDPTFYFEANAVKDELAADFVLKESLSDDPIIEDEIAVKENKDEVKQSFPLNKDKIKTDVTNESKESNTLNKEQNKMYENEVKVDDKVENNKVINKSNFDTINDGENVESNSLPEESAEIESLVQEKEVEEKSPAEFEDAENLNAAVENVVSNQQPLDAEPEIFQNIPEELEPFAEDEHFSEELGQDLEENILEVIDAPEEMDNSNDEIEERFWKNETPPEIQDNAISTTENITSPEEKIVPVDELIDSDPEVSSSHTQVEMAAISKDSDDSKDSDESHTDSEQVDNLIGIPKQEEETTPPDTVDVEAFVNIAPEVKRETKNSQFNLVPYVDTDSDCESVEDYEKRTAASGKFAVHSVSRTMQTVQEFIKVEEVDDKPNLENTGIVKKTEAPTASDDKRCTIEGSDPKQPGNRLFRKMFPRELRSLSSDARIVVKADDMNVNLYQKESLCSDVQIVGPDLDKIKDVQGTQIEQKSARTDSHEAAALSVPLLDTEAIKMLNELDIPLSSKLSEVPRNESFLVKEVSPSREELSRALNRVRKASGDKIHISLARNNSKGQQRVTPPSPQSDIQAELVNFAGQSKPAADEYNFPSEQGSEVGSYQALARPGKVGRKKPSKSALNHETEETQMQADVARQQQERKRLKMTRQLAGGSMRAATGPSVLKTNQTMSPQGVGNSTTSVIRQVPRQMAEHQGLYQPAPQSAVFPQQTQRGCTSSLQTEARTQQGYQLALSEASQQQEYNPASQQGYQPAPQQGYQPTPQQGYRPAPPQRYPPAIKTVETAHKEYQLSYNSMTTGNLSSHQAGSSQNQELQGVPQHKVLSHEKYEVAPQIGVFLDERFQAAAHEGYQPGSNKEVFSHQGPYSNETVIPQKGHQPSPHAGVSPKQGEEPSQYVGISPLQVYQPSLHSAVSPQLGDKPVACTGVSTPTQLLPVLSTPQLRRMMVPQLPMEFVTITSQPTMPQANRRPPAGINVHNSGEDITDLEQILQHSRESSPAGGDAVAGPSFSSKSENWDVRSAPKCGNKMRRSVETMDHSYVMEVDSDSEDDFDLSEKLEEMEKAFDKPELAAGPEESLEAIKSLLESQVPSQRSSDPNSSQGTVSLSDGDDLGLYSPGDEPKPGVSESIIVLDDTISRNTSVVSINSDVSVGEHIDNVINFSNEKKTFPIRISPMKVQKSQDETYDDVDDLLGDSDDDEEQEEKEEKKELFIPIIKPVTPSESSKKKPPQFVCPECNQKFRKNEREFNNHIRQDHNFHCKFCPLKFTYVNGLEEHCNLIHINETAKENSTSFCCNICNKSFTRQGPYLKHKKRDHNIPCIECDMVFTNEPFLEEHMASMHGINSPPAGKMVKMRKPTSPVEVKFHLANGMILDSPKKIAPKQETINYLYKEKKDLIKKSAPKIQFGKELFKKGKSSKSSLKKFKDVSILSDDDTICEKCGKKYEELEAFEHHIELPHEHQCGMKNCELSFVHQYYLELHIFNIHKSGIKPDERDRPIEEMVTVAVNAVNESVLEDQISLADLAVSEDYLPGFGPQSMLCGGDPAKVKSLKGYKIPKKGSSPVNNDSDLSLNSSLNSSRSLENTPVKMSDMDSPARNAFKCYQCDKSFSDRSFFDQHVSNHYNHGRNLLGSPSSSSDPYKCYECNLVFKVQAELDLHVSSHYNPRQQSSSKGYSTKKLKCPLCSQYFDDMPNMMDHLKAKHKSGRSEKKHDLWCGLCRKGFESEKKFEDHEKLDHKYACSHCHKAYILEVDLNHHVEKNHNIQTRHKEGFTCKLCGENISEMEMFKIHQSQGHNVPCYLDGCEKRFQHKKELLAHLKIKHNIVQIRIGDDSEDEHRGYLTTERSQANIDIAEWAESWIDSAMAIDHMVKVMKGVVKSRRHDLFLDKRERDKCSGSETSRLYQLSNPGFLGGGGEKDTVVIKHLIDRVFMVNFPMADNRLKDLGVGSAFVYTSCVLFPETFIHQHQVQGKSREEAEQAFMEVAVDVEERKGLNQEIKEAAVRNRRDSDEDSGDEWVDHSDMEEDLED